MSTQTTTKRKTFTADRLRLLLQIVFLIIAPAPFSTAFAGVKSLAAKVGAGDPLALSAMLKFCLALIVFTILFGRFFCGTACAFGTYTDLLNRLARKLKIKQIRALDRFAPWGKYAVLVVILVLCFTGLGSIVSLVSPWDVFAKLLAFNFNLSGYIIGIIVLLLVSAGCLFVERFFCRFLCPMGAIFSLLAWFPVLRLQKDRTNCNSCKACSSVCPAKINLSQMDTVKSGECFRCYKCVDICPRNNASTQLFGKPFSPYISILIQALLLFLILLYFHAVRF